MYVQGEEELDLSQLSASLGVLGTRVYSIRLSCIWIESDSFLVRLVGCVVPYGLRLSHGNMVRFATKVVRRVIFQSLRMILYCRMYSDSYFTQDLLICLTRCFLKYLPFTFTLHATVSLVFYYGMLFRPACAVIPSFQKSTKFSPGTIARSNS